MIDFQKTALVLIDLQEGITQLDCAPHTTNTVVQNANRLIEIFRQNQGFISFVHVSFHDGHDRLQPNAQQMLPGKHDAQFSKFAKDLAILETDYVVNKRQFSAFFGTDLDLQLRRRGIDTIVLGGIATHIGVDTTARDAYQQNYQQYFISDMMTAPKKEWHEFSTQTIFPLLGQVLTTDAFIASISSKKPIS